MSNPDPTPADPAGVTPTPTPPPTPPAAPPIPAPDTGTDDLAKLRDALASERSLRKDAEKRAKEGDATKAELDKLQAASQTDLEKAVAAARKEGSQAVLGASNLRLVNAEARALAAEARFRNPSLAVRAIDLTGITVTDDGTVDTAAISAALKTLAADEPYLVDDNSPRIPKPDPSQGPKGTPVPPGAEKGLAEAARRYGTKAAT